LSLRKTKYYFTPAFSVKLLLQQKYDFRWVNK